MKELHDMIVAWTRENRDVSVTLSYANSRATVVVSMPGKETKQMWAEDWETCLQWVVEEYLREKKKVD